MVIWLSIAISFKLKYIFLSRTIPVYLSAKLQCDCKDILILEYGFKIRMNILDDKFLKQLMAKKLK